MTMDERIQSLIKTLRRSIEQEQHLPQDFHRGHVMGMRFALEMLIEESDETNRTDQGKTLQFPGTG